MFGYYRYNLPIVNVRHTRTDRGRTDTNIQSLEGFITRLTIGRSRCGAALNKDQRERKEGEEGLIFCWKEERKILPNCCWKEIYLLARRG